MSDDPRRCRVCDCFDERVLDISYFNSAVRAPKHSLPDDCIRALRHENERVELCASRLSQACAEQQTRIAELERERDEARRAALEDAAQIVCGEWSFMDYEQAVKVADAIRALADRSER